MPGHLLVERDKEGDARATFYTNRESLRLYREHPSYILLAKYYEDFRREVGRRELEDE